MITNSRISISFDLGRSIDKHFDIDHLSRSNHLGNAQHWNSSRHTNAWYRNVDLVDLNYYLCGARHRQIVRIRYCIVETRLFYIIFCTKTRNVRFSFSLIFQAIAVKLNRRIYNVYTLHDYSIIVKTNCSGRIIL